jgi:hypothetical protein
MRDGMHATEHEPVRSLTSLRHGSAQAGRLPDAAEVVRHFNAENRAHLQLWRRVLQATDAVTSAAASVRAAAAGSADAEAAYQVAQAEHPDRTAPRPRQLALVAIALALDGLACNFAAQALGESGRSTLLWTGYFLAVLAAGEVGLDLYRRHRVAWRLLAGSLAGFVAMLGALRYWYLFTVTTQAAGPALLGAGLFTVATASFLALGYRALRPAETAATWRARRRVNARERDAGRARAAADRAVAARDQLANAYLSVLRARLLESCTASQLTALQQAVRGQLTGQPQVSS